MLHRHQMVCSKVLQSLVLTDEHAEVLAKVLFLFLHKKHPPQKKGQQEQFF